VSVLALLVKEPARRRFDRLLRTARKGSGHVRHGAVCVQSRLAVIFGLQRNTILEEPRPSTTPQPGYSTGDATVCQRRPLHADRFAQADDCGGLHGQATA